MKSLCLHVLKSTSSAWTLLRPSIAVSRYSFLFLFIGLVLLVQVRTRDVGVGLMDLLHLVHSSSSNDMICESANHSKIRTIHDTVEQANEM